MYTILQKKTLWFIMALWALMGLTACVGTGSGVSSNPGGKAVNDRRDLAEYYYSIGKYEQAGKEYQWLVTQLPEDIYVNYKYGVVLGKLGIKDRSIQQFLRVAELDEMHQKAHFNLGVLFSDKNDATYDPGKAAYHLQRYLELFPTSPHRRKIEKTLSAMHASFSSGENTDDHRPSENNSPSATLFLEKANRFYGEGRLKEAKQLYLNHVITHPDDSNAHYRLGVIYVKSKELVNGRTHMLKAVTLDPGLSKGYYNLGVIYSTKGETYNKEKAAFFFEKFLEMEPESPRRKEISAWLKRN